MSATFVTEFSTYCREWLNCQCYSILLPVINIHQGMASSAGAWEVAYHDQYNPIRIAARHWMDLLLALPWSYTEVGLWNHGWLRIFLETLNQYPLLRNASWNVESIKDTRYQLMAYGVKKLGQSVTAPMMGWPLWFEYSMRCCRKNQMFNASRWGNDPWTPEGALSAMSQRSADRMLLLNTPNHDNTVMGRVCRTVLGSRTLVGIAILANFTHQAKGLNLRWTGSTIHTSFALWLWNYVISGCVHWQLPEAVNDLVSWIEDLIISVVTESHEILSFPILRNACQFWSHCSSTYLDCPRTAASPGRMLAVCRL